MTDNSKKYHVQALTPDGYGEPEGAQFLGEYDCDTPDQARALVSHLVTLGWSADDLRIVDADGTVL